MDLLVNVVTMKHFPPFSEIFLDCQEKFRIYTFRVTFPPNKSFHPPKFLMTFFNLSCTKISFPLECKKKFLPPKMAKKLFSP